MDIVIWSQECLILPIESFLIGAVIGKPDQREDLYLSQIQRMIIGVPPEGETLGPTNVEMVITITIMGAGVIRIVEIMGMPEMFTFSHRELLQGAL